MIWDLTAEESAAQTRMRELMKGLAASPMDEDIEKQIDELRNSMPFLTGAMKLDLLAQVDFPLKTCDAACDLSRDIYTRRSRLVAARMAGMLRGYEDLLREKANMLGIYYGMLKRSGLPENVIELAIQEEIRAMPSVFQ